MEQVKVDVIKCAIKDIEKWRGEAYQVGDEVWNALEVIKRTIGINEVSRDVLIDMVIEEIKTNIDNGDVTVLSEILTNVSNEVLMNSLPEDITKNMIVTKNL